MIRAWSAHSLNKIFPDTPPPAEAGSAPVLRLSAARGEVEAAQLALHSAESVTVEAAETPRLRAGDVEIEVTVRLVGFVTVTGPSHGDGQPGPHPDPLSPFRPFTIEGTRSLWVDARVPREARPGIYAGDAGEARKQGQEALAQVKRVAASTTDYAQDPAALLAARAGIAGAITALRAAGVEPGRTDRPRRSD